MKSLSKILIIFTILSILLLSTTTYAGTVDIDKYTLKDITSEDKQDAVNITKSILAYIKYIGFALTVIMIMVIGIKYILSSVEEKASYKENFVPLIAGAILLSGAAILPSVLYNMFHTTTP